MRDAADKADRWAGEVVAASRDLLRLVNRDRRSPAYGCFHPPFWLNKTSDYPNARCQEAAYTLALLHRNDYPGNSWRGVEEIRELALAGLRFWARRQHPDGSSDEWYRGERGFAATAFTAYALSRAFVLLAPGMAEPERGELVSSFRRAASWLARHQDLNKLNHEAVGAAALFALAAATGDEPARAAARAKRDRVLAAQRGEGWFPELGGCDTGYSFITVEYLVRCWLLDPDEKLRLACERALDFLRFFVHPDLMTGPEYNLCRNHYVSLLAAAALGGVSPTARGIFREGAARASALEQITQDDLIRCFHLYTGLEAYDAFRSTRGSFEAGDPPLPFQGPPYRRYFPESRLVSVKAPSYFAVASGDCGGLIRFYACPPAGSPLSSGLDQGVAAAPRGGPPLFSSLYSTENRVECGEDGSLRVSASLKPGKYFFPGRTARFAVSLLSSLPGGYLLIKKGMDFVRSRKKATFQISAVSGEGSGWRIRREVAWGEDRIVIEDAVAPPPGAAAAEIALDFDLRRDGLVVSRPFAGRSFGGGTIRKEIVFRGGEIAVEP